MTVFPVRVEKVPLLILISLDQFCTPSAPTVNTYPDDTYPPVEGLMETVFRRTNLLKSPDDILSTVTLFYCDRNTTE